MRLSGGTLAFEGGLTRYADDVVKRRLERLPAAGQEMRALRPLALGLEDELGAALDDIEIGGFRLRRLIAAGGSGIVYEADQDEPPRRAALKVARPGPGRDTPPQRLRAPACAPRPRSGPPLPRHNGTAPLPVWSGNRERHRLSRTGNRQLNAAIHRIAITQMRWHDDARGYLERRLANGNTRTEALRALKRRLSDVVYRALLADAPPLSATRVASPGCNAEAA